MTNNNIDLKMEKIYLETMVNGKTAKRVKISLKLKEDATSFRFGPFIWNDASKKIEVDEKIVKDQDRTPENSYVRESVKN